jgi:hypothetical protein
MPLDTDYALSLLPGQLPPLNEDFIGYLAGDLSNRKIDDLLPIATWTFYLGQEFERSELWRQIPGYLHFKVGYWGDDASGYAFGVIAYTDPRVGTPSSYVAELELDIRSFPVSVRRWNLDRSVGPLGGLTTCHAESKRLAQPNNVGFLTADHTVYRNRTGSVLTTNGVAKLLDVAPNGIDAALVSYPQGTGPTFTAKIQPVRSFLVQSTTVEFNDQNGQSISAKVLAVPPFPPLNPHWAYIYEIDQPGQPGDSGAYVWDHASGDGCGIYVARGGSSTGTAVGYCQHLGQAEHVLSLDLYV